jgi:hypothetical protein
MKKVALTVFFVSLALVLSVIPAQSFNPAAQLYIADHLFPNLANKTDLYYGSIAPDLAMYTDVAKWPNSFLDTHYTYINLINPQGANQKAFAKGWFTHNEINGADHYAHGIYDPNTGYYIGGYVTIQAHALLGLMGLDFPPYQYLDFAHFAIEAAIDLLLKQEHDPSLSTKLFLANLLRSPLDRELLTKVLVVQNRETDWINLITTELTFRNLVYKYSTALALSNLSNKNALITLGVQLAQQEFGITATPEYLRQVFDAAIGLCQATQYYETAILPAIQNIPH